MKSLPNIKTYQLSTMTDLKNRFWGYKLCIETQNLIMRGIRITNFNHWENKK